MVVVQRMTQISYLSVNVVKMGIYVRLYNVFSKPAQWENDK